MAGFTVLVVLPPVSNQSFSSSHFQTDELFACHVLVTLFTPPCRQYPSILRDMYATYKHSHCELYIRHTFSFSFAQGLPSKQGRQQARAHNVAKGSRPHQVFIRVLDLWWVRTLLTILLQQLCQGLKYWRQVWQIPPQEVGHTSILPNSDTLVGSVLVTIASTFPRSEEMQFLLI